MTMVVAAFLASLVPPARAATEPVPLLAGPVTQAVASVTLVPPAAVLGGVSSDGRYVLFTSSADNLVTNDFNGDCDVFVFDRQEGRTTLVSLDQAGRRSGNGSSLNAGFSSDGRRVVFQSRASDLVPGDSNHTWDVFLRDSTWQELATTVGDSFAVDVDVAAAGQRFYRIVGLPGL
jgi:Tol biopolymer transport system component